VAEPPELHRLKYASPLSRVPTYFERCNPLVCRVSARYNHGSTGSMQVFPRTKANLQLQHNSSLLIYKHVNIITSHVQLQIKSIQMMFKLTSWTACLCSQRKGNKHATTLVAKVDTMLSPRPGVTPEGHCQPGTDPIPRTSQKEQKLDMQGCP
jgi:hypothetical protein